MNKAIFLDRDGVINKMIYNSDRRELEPPHKPEDLELFPWTIESLKSLEKNNYLLFLISNQPDYAKGKCSLEDLFSAHKKLDEIFKENEINFKEYYYCYHHPDGIVKEYSYVCECRKPKPYFIKKAIKLYDLENKTSWMIGDRDTDILCGKAERLKTILIKNDFENMQGRSKPNYFVNDLKEAVDIIIKNQEKI